MAIKAVKGLRLFDQNAFTSWKMLLLVLLILWNGKESAHATQGKQTYAYLGDRSDFLTVHVTVDGKNRNRH